MTVPDLSIAVFAGQSIPALHATLTSVRRAVLRLRAEIGMSVEILLIRQAGGADLSVHVGCLKDLQHLRVLACMGNDPAAARRLAASSFHGRYAAFLDAGDMWSGNFLTEAARAARREGARHSVWRPDAVIGCGLDFFSFDLHGVFQPPILDAKDGARLLHECPYAPSFCAHRDILDSVCFPLSDLQRGWQDTDAWWTADALGRGHGQRILEGTALYRWNKGQGGPHPVRIGPTYLFDTAKRVDGKSA